LGSLQYGSGIISTLLIAAFGTSDGNPWTMSWIIALFSALSFGILFVGKLINNENEKRIV